MREEIEVSPFRVFLGALLIGGTAIGAGMLGLPLSTAEGGMIPSWTMYLLCWLFSIATGFLFVEIGLWLPPKANIVTMASRILGPVGKYVAWILYIFLFYCLTVAYVAGGGKIVADYFGGGCPAYMGILSFTLFFGLFVYLGTKVAGRLNGVLMGGLIATYCVFVFLGSSKVNFANFQSPNWKAAIFGLPIIFSSFSYQGTLPSLMSYLGYNPKKMRLAILLGTSLPFIVYLMWDIIIKGIIPVSGPHGLLAAKEAGLSAVAPLAHYLHGSHIYVIGNLFAFFALTTSFIGVTLGLLDFLADGLQVKNKGASRFGLCCLIFIPAVVISLINPSIFLQALGYAGGFGCALLLGLMPVVMVYVGRYKKGYSSIYEQLPGGKMALLLLALFVLFEVGVEIFLELSRVLS